MEPLVGADLKSVGNVEDKFVVPTDVRADELRVDPNGGGLAGAFEVERTQPLCSGTVLGMLVQYQPWPR